MGVWGFVKEGLYFFGGEALFEDVVNVGNADDGSSTIRCLRKNPGKCVKTITNNSGATLPGWQQPRVFTDSMNALVQCPANAVWDAQGDCTFDNRSLIVKNYENALKAIQAEDPVTSVAPVLLSTCSPQVQKEAEGLKTRSTDARIAAVTALGKSAEECAFMTVLSTATYDAASDVQAAAVVSLIRYIVKYPSNMLYRAWATTALNVIASKVAEYVDTTYANSSAAPKYITQPLYAVAVNGLVAIQQIPVPKLPPKRTFPAKEIVLAAAGIGVVAFITYDVLKRRANV